MPVPIAADVQSQLIEQSFAEARPALEPWFGAEALRENLATEIARDLAATREDGVRLLELSSGRWVLLHVPRGDSTHPNPWTIVRRRTFAITEQKSLCCMVAEVRAALAPYRANRILVFTHGQPLPNPPADHLVAGLIDELRLPAGLPPANLRLVEPQSMEFYEQYRNWYEEFWRRRPHLSEVWIEKREDIEDCMEQGGVRLVYLGGELCGMLAAQRRVEFGLSGWRMRERVTAPARWGQGISTVALVEFARSLVHQPHEAIWGNILPSNPSSLESALRIRRRVVGTYYEARSEQQGCADEDGVRTV